MEQQIHQMLKKPLHLISKFGLGFRANQDLDPNPNATTQSLSLWWLEKRLFNCSVLIMELSPWEDTNCFYPVLLKQKLKTCYLR